MSNCRELLLSIPELIRWKTTAIVAVCAALTATRLDVQSGEIRGILAVVLIAAAGFALNDFHDYRIDAVNAPRRPIPSGRASPGEAVLLAIALFVAGNALAFTQGWRQLAIALLTTLSLLGYSPFFKKHGILGNVMTALLGVAIFVYFALPTGAWAAILYPSVLTFSFVIGREALKDVLDTRGDRIAGRTTIALCFSPALGRVVAASMFLITSVLAIVNVSRKEDATISILFGIGCAILALLTARCKKELYLRRLLEASRLVLLGGLIGWGLHI